MTANRQAATSPGTDPASVKGYVLEDQIGFLIRRSHQRATAIFDQVMSGFEVTPVQYAALAKLHDLGATSQNALGRLVGIDPATMFGVAGRLAKRGLVTPSVDPNDARLVLLELTDVGRETVEAMKARGIEVTDKTLAPLTPDEAETLVRLLTKLG
ncbi:MarR family winged helix-turn-helix transcriptional regulator [Phreatobacter stygius]|uniref:MarR family transcriptional regulator n=1 Tax=Phreatobacter stygius TaxID=1940610 RepID=A0A4D7B109_9HYPH|nr:MarR family transcriptional regulator [Phreatobacter stygius]QCI66451.1 MarR family transcriptional regulator [Phreatobacter stygius]